MRQRTKVLLTLGVGILVLLAAAVILLRGVRLEVKLTADPGAPGAGGAQARGLDFVSLGT